MAAARHVRDSHHGPLVTYSPKAFFPLTKLCRDICRYCTFSESPGPTSEPYLLPDGILSLSQRAMAAGCSEALLTLGDKPEERYAIARSKLNALGHDSTISYLHSICDLILSKTTLIPHTNPGLLTRDDMIKLRAVSASQGMMIESLNPELSKPGGVHFGSPDKDPDARLEALYTAGELKIPFTTGLLVGIGESRDDRVYALHQIRKAHLRFNHIQEVIIQGFRSKSATNNSGSEDAEISEILWTIAIARFILPPDVHIQTPPNLFPRSCSDLLDAGIDDWGGISPITIDHVNPEAQWPTIELLSGITNARGKTLVPRLPVYPNWISSTWIDTRVLRKIHQSSNSSGLLRSSSWTPGTKQETPSLADFAGRDRGSPKNLSRIVAKAKQGERLSVDEIRPLFSPDSLYAGFVLHSADSLRRSSSGSTVRYVINRNINYTNICYYRCSFCAFSKGTASAGLRGSPYNIDGAEIIERGVQAWNRGATELCLQGGIHPEYTGDTYNEICRAIKRVLPAIHVHAFSPLEISQGAFTAQRDIGVFLDDLKKGGLGTLPGTAAEVLDDCIRSEICPDKLNTAEWLDVVRSSHRSEFRTTSTIMFGHVDRPGDWARHILAIRDLQNFRGGFTEFVPLPFIHNEAPMYLRGQSRKGPTFIEAILMHAVCRLALNPGITNIQTSWVKMGVDGVAECLASGANDVGGTLMNESISRAAGSEHGQELTPDSLAKLILGNGRRAQQRGTEYQPIPTDRGTLSRDRQEHIYI